MISKKDIKEAVEILENAIIYCPICKRREGGTIPHSKEMCEKRNMDCKNQKFGHNFQIAGGDCFKCGINQNDLSYPKKTTQDSLSNILERNRNPKKHKKGEFQATYHQELAVETAKMLGDLKSLGIYLRLFKRYDRTDLLECRAWVLEKGKGKNLGRLFVSVHKKFVDNAK